MKRTLSIVVVLAVVILLTGIFAPWDSTEEASLAPLRTVKTIDAMLYGGAISSDARRAATYCKAAHVIKVWDLETGLNRLTINDDFLLNDALPNLRFSPDGSTIARTAKKTLPSDTKEIRLYSSETGEIKRRIAFGQKSIDRMDFSPFGGRLAVMIDGVGWKPQSQIEIWDIEGATLVRSFLVEGANGCFFSPDGKTILTGTFTSSGPEDATVTAARLWDVESGNLVQEFRATRRDFGDLAFSPDGSQIATAGTRRNGNCKIWDVASGKMIHRLIAYAGEGRGIYPLAFSPDGTILATAYFQKKLNFDNSLWGRVRTKVGNAFPFLAPEMDLNGRIVLWDVRSGTRFRTYNLLSAGALDMKFTPDGRQLLAIDTRGTVRWWDASG